MIKTLLAVVLLAAFIGAGWTGWESLLKDEGASAGSVPATTVKRGEVVISVTARGELQGGNSQMLVAPMTGGRDMVITELREPGEEVNEGQVVAQFDTTEQEFELREAEADLAEAEQQVIQANAESEAREIEARYELSHARALVQLAELEMLKNELLPAIVARQNTLALDAARDRVRQLEQDQGNRAATSKAGIAIQQAARNKAQVKAETARKTIESMTLKAARHGYVSIQQNMDQNMMYWGMQLPILQSGDRVRAGMAVAQIPDMEKWEVTASIGELDRGHLAVGQDAEVRIVALPGQAFRAKIVHIGGTTGPPWDRHFDCRLALQQPTPELRPGMSARIVINTGALKDVIWVPAQALFESDGKSFVHVRRGGRFQRQDVKLVRRSETRAIVEGIAENEVVALASPDQVAEKKKSGSLSQAIPKS